MKEKHSYLKVLLRIFTLSWNIKILSLKMITHCFFMKELFKSCDMTSLRKYVIIKRSWNLWDYIALLIFKLTGEFIDLLSTKPLQYGIPRSRWFKTHKNSIRNKSYKFFESQKLKFCIQFKNLINHTEIKFH